MNVQFKNSFYFQAYSQNNSFNPKLFKENPKFVYEEPNYYEYSKLYNDDGFLRRKLTAIPNAIWSGFAKAIYHLAQAILCWLPGMPNNHEFFFKAQVFNIVRDLQESFGRILSIFNDRLGLFHIQQAQFYKSCYHCFQNDEIMSASSIANSNAQLALKVELQKVIEEHNALQENLQAHSSKLKTESAEKFDRFIEDQIVRIEENENGQDAAIKAMIKESIVHSIDQYIRLNLSLGVLTLQEINAILDDYRTTYPEAAYSFLSDLKR